MIRDLPEPPRPGSISNRRYERISIEECPVEITVVASVVLRLFGKGGNCGIEVVDISESGMRALVRKQLAPGTRVTWIAKISWFGETLEGAARIVWCSPAKQDGQFLAGLDFTQLPDGHQQKIGLLRRTVRSPEFRQKIKTRKRAIFQPSQDPNKPDGQEGLEIMEPPTQ